MEDVCWRWCGVHGNPYAAIRCFIWLQSLCHTSIAKGDITHYDGLFIYLKPVKKRHFEKGHSGPRANHGSKKTYVLLPHPQDSPFDLKYFGFNLSAPSLMGGSFYDLGLLIGPVFTKNSLTYQILELFNETGFQCRESGKRARTLSFASCRKRQLSLPLRILFRLPGPRYFA